MSSEDKVSFLKENYMCITHIWWELWQASQWTYTDWFKRQHALLPWRDMAIPSRLQTFKESNTDDLLSLVHKKDFATKSKSVQSMMFQLKASTSFFIAYQPLKCLALLTALKPQTRQSSFITNAKHDNRK